MLHDPGNLLDRSEIARRPVWWPQGDSLEHFSDAEEVSSVPLAANEFGPSTAAPERKGGPLGGIGMRFATWCCMQSGKVVPSFTISDVPQAFVPSMFASWRFA